MSKRTYVTARVRVVLDIPVGDSWGTDCKMQQIRDQAADSAKGMLQQHVAYRPSEIHTHALAKIAALDCTGPTSSPCDADTCAKCIAVKAIGAVKTERRPWKIVEELRVTAVMVEEE